MNRVVTINLNGNAYQLDEGAFDALRAYLDRAEARLASNPDRAEIIADLEQAIAEKCNHHLGPNKNVVSAAEIAQVLVEMGPVETPADEGAAPDAAEAGGASVAAGADTGVRRRLYRIREGAMISGVCNGLAAFFSIDVTVMRIIFVALAVLTSGAWIIAYVVMIFVIPRADTGEEHAAAHGMPFNARELIDRTRQFRDYARESRRWRREERQHWREWRRAMRGQVRWGPMDRGPVSYGARVLAGFLVPVASIISAVLFVAFFVGVFSLLATGAIFEWPLPSGTPLWVAILALIVIYLVVVSPFRAMRHASYYALGYRNYGWFAAWGGLLWLGFVALALWFAYTYVPGVQEFMQGVPHSWNGPESGAL